MNNTLYRAGIHLVPRLPVRLSGWTGKQPDPALEKRIAAVLSRQRVRGGTLALTDGQTISAASFGTIRKDGSLPARPDVFFRAASVSKFVTACAALTLARQGKISLEEDIGAYLGFPVRNPHFHDIPVTLAMLLSHTSSIRDGESYLTSLSAPPPFPDLLKKDCFAKVAPGTQWDYSNLAAGIIGCVLEGALQKPFDRIMRETVFDPLNIDASFHPGRIGGTLSDAWRLLPPARHAGYNAVVRQRAVPKDENIDLQMDYLLAHGSLCIRAGDLLALGQAAVRSDFFPEMREKRASFGARDRTLSEGLGTFLYQEEGMAEPLYGHQGLAYGAVHGLFLNGRGEGFALLTSAASEEREGVMTALNISLCRLLFPDGRCRPW